MHGASHVPAQQSSLCPPMKQANDSYHCFMGNGLDAVLIGYTGAMVEERAQGNLDRCYWYKADRYYPENRTAVTPSRLPREGQPLRAEGSAWHELAPLARTWYEVRHDGLRLDVRATSQYFVPEEGILHSHVDYGPVEADVVTFLHAKRPMLVIRYQFSGPVHFRAYAAAGVWVEEGYDAEPFEKVSYTSGGIATYTLGSNQGRIMLALEPEPSAGIAGNAGKDSSNSWLEVTAQEITHYFSVVDDFDGPIDEHVLDEARALGYAALREEHLLFWRGYAAQSHVEIPDPDFQRFYDYSLYQFKAAQNRLSGGLPVNNLRLTWSSHLFWDAYFMHRALLTANHREEALEGARFFMRTLEAARRHAQDDFGAPGLKWDWEITHRGERAYGTWLHQKEQVHNNAAYANIIWGYYEFTRDRAYLAEFYPLLRGIAEFFLANVIEETTRGYEVRALVDVHERVERVRNEGLNLTGAIRILQVTSWAAAVLDTDTDFAERCRLTSSGLIDTLDLLYNGRYFTGAEGADTLNFSSLAPVYPMMLVPAADPRALSTAQAYMEHEKHEEKYVASPWSAGILATVFALCGDGDKAWRVILESAGSLCRFGGMSEFVLAGGLWNMQYFSTAQAAVCTAIHHLLVQGRSGEISLFPAVPSSWPGCSYTQLLVNGVEVSGCFDRGSSLAWAEMQNIASEPLTTRVRYGEHTHEILLSPGQREVFRWEIH